MRQASHILQEKAVLVLFSLTQYMKIIIVDIGLLNKEFFKGRNGRDYKDI